MTDQTPIRPASQDDALTRFDSRQSMRGMLLSYCDARAARFRDRMIMYGVAMLTVALVSRASLAVTCVVLAFGGELVDRLALDRARRRLRAGDPLAPVSRRLMFASLVQVLLSCAAVGLLWVSQPWHTAAVFCFAYIASVAVYAGLMYQYAPRIVGVRLAGLALMVVLMLGYDLLFRAENAATFVYDLVGALLLVYLTAGVILQVNRLDRRNRDANRAILVAQAETEAINRDLLAQQEQLRRMSLVARHARDSIIVTDGQGRIEWVNGAFCDFSGYDASEVLGRDAANLLMRSEADSPDLAELAEVIRRQEPYRGVFPRFRKSGEQLWVDTNVVPVPGPDGRTEYVVSVDRDVTEERARATELAEAKARAERGEKARADFLAIMSHEIRTPMNGVIGMADLLAQKPLDPDSRLYVETIRGSADALLNIINDILDLSRLDAGRFEISPEPFLPRDCVERVVELLRPQAEVKGLTLAVVTDPDVPRTALGDEGRIRQVLMNLLGNAIKFTAQGGVTVRVSARPEGKGQGHRVTIAVEDTGIGIPADRQEMIFGAFSQADGARTTRTYGGTGLGLTISRLLARRMGGDLTVRSEPGHGACFSLALPLGAPSPAAPRVSGPPDAGDAERLPPGLRILVVEDNATNRLLMAKLLADLPVELAFATDGAEAVEAQAGSGFDIVLMDMSMPGMDGLEATRRIRASPGPQPRIVALTANAYAADRSACLDAGMDDFLSKPVRRAELIDRLSALAGHHDGTGRDNSGAGPPGG